MYRVRRIPTLIGAITGFLLLAAPTAILFALGIFGAILHAGTLTIGAALLVVTIGVAVGVQYEWRFLWGRFEWPPIDLTEALKIGASILGGTLLTLAGAVEIGLSPIVAAGIVGIAAAIVVPDRAVPAYCGAFVGMTSPDLFATYWHATAAGLVASAVFLVAQPAFHGIGGKLGTTAFVGATAIVLATTGTFESVALPDPGTVAVVVCYAIVGAVVTFALHARFDRSPVFASGIVGAVGGVGLPLVYSEFGGLMAAAVFAASFAGMTDVRRIPDERWIALAGLLVGLVVVYTGPYLGGSGGKLGTIAFGSCLAVHGLLRTAHIVRLRFRIEEFRSMDTT